MGGDKRQSQRLTALALLLEEIKRQEASGALKPETAKALVAAALRESQADVPLWAEMLRASPQRHKQPKRRLLPHRQQHLQQQQLASKEQQLQAAKEKRQGKPKQQQPSSWAEPLRHAPLYRGKTSRFNRCINQPARQFDRAQLASEAAACFGF